MNIHFQKVKEYLLELGFTLNKADESEGVLVVENEDAGIKNVVLIVADPILIVEQYLFDLPPKSDDMYQKLLAKNRDIIHGAFALDESGNRLLFRNTHVCENLNLNELETTLNSLSLLLSEYANELIAFSKR